MFSTALPQIAGKTVKAIAVLNRERTPVLPDVPTAQEPGLNDFEVPGWFALFAPKQIPAPIIRRLNTALGETLDTPLLRERLEGLGMSIPPPRAPQPGISGPVRDQRDQKMERPDRGGQHYDGLNGIVCDCRSR